MAYDASAPGFIIALPPREQAVIDADMACETLALAQDVEPDDCEDPYPYGIDPYDAYPYDEEEAAYQAGLL